MRLGVLSDAASDALNQLPLLTQQQADADWSNIEILTGQLPNYMWELNSALAYNPPSMLPPGAPPSPQMQTYNTAYTQAIAAGLNATQAANKALQTAAGVPSAVPVLNAGGTFAGISTTAWLAIAVVAVGGLVFLGRR